MSWLARSVINSLRPDPDSDSDSDAPPPPDSDAPPPAPDSDSQPPTPSRGVKEDISELTQTLTRQFWGVASFLAPPPGSDAPGSDSESDEDPVSGPALAGIRSDLAEIGGKVRSGISVLSSKGVSEVSKIASTLFGDDDEEDEDREGEEMVGGVGVSEEVVAFVRSVSLHPETWLDFPVLRGDDAPDDFDLSDAQEEHALLIEQLAPSLAALRFQLCPHHMSEGCFWKIYFVLLHPKLSKHDAGLLSTPQIVQARATLLQDMPIRRQPISDQPGIETLDLSLVDKLATIDTVDEVVGLPSQIPIFGMPTKEQTPEKTPDSASNPSTEIETDKHPVPTTDVQIVEKSVIEEEPTVQVKREDTPSSSMTVPSLRYEEDNDEWLEEEPGETSVSRGMPVHLGNEEEVSFSDLEADDDDDDEGMRLSSKTKTPIGSPTKDESGWVELDKGSEGAPRSGDTSSPDWLDVDMDTV